MTTLLTLDRRRIIITPDRVNGSVILGVYTFRRENRAVVLTRQRRRYDVALTAWNAARRAVGVEL